MSPPIQVPADGDLCRPRLDQYFPQDQALPNPPAPPRSCHRGTIWSSLKARDAAAVFQRNPCLGGPPVLFHRAEPVRAIEHFEIAEYRAPIQQQPGGHIVPVTVGFCFDVRLAPDGSLSPEAK